MGKTIGSTIRAVRIERGITQGAAAEQIGVGRQTWYIWERGENLPSDSHWAKLALFCDMSLVEFSRKAENERNERE